MSTITDNLYFDKYLVYIRDRLKHYAKGEDIFEHCVNSVINDLEPTISRISDSISFITLYYAILNLEDKKGLIKRDEIIPELLAYREKLEKFCENKSRNFSTKESYVFKIDDLLCDQYMERYVPIILDKPEGFRKYFGNELRKDIVGTIQYIAAKMEDLDIIDAYVKCSNNGALSRRIKFELELGELKTEEKIIAECLERYDSNFFPTTARENFYEEWLIKQSLEKLVYINLFWCNKFAKLIEDLLMLMVSISKTKTLLHGIKDDNLDAKTLFYCLENNIMSKHKMAVLFEQISQDSDSNQTVHFDEYFKEDIRMLLPIYKFLDVVYVLKNISTFSALKTLEEDKEVKNYGVSRLTINSNMLAFIIDLPGYNLPISFHIEKSTLITFYEEFSKSKKIREYVGAEDFYGEKKWGNSFLYPLSKEQREVLKNIKIKNNQIEHLKFLQTRIWPEHMRDSKGKGIKRYIEIDKLK